MDAATQIRSHQQHAPSDARTFDLRPAALAAPRGSGPAAPVEDPPDAPHVDAASSLRFHVEGRRIIVEVLDADGEIVRVIPPEELANIKGRRPSLMDLHV